MKIRKEITWERGLNDKKYTASISLFGQFRQFNNVSARPFGRRIRKHGDIFTEECAGLDLKIVIILPVMQKKIEPASFVFYLGSFYLPPFETIDHVI